MVGPSATAVSRPVGSPPYPAPWLSTAVMEAISFFRYQQLMKVPMDVDHGICREHYETFVQAMCGNTVDKLKVLFSIVSAVTNYIQTTYQGAEKAHWSSHPDVREKSEVLADQLLSSERTYYELQKTRHSLRIRSSQCSDKVRDTLSAGKGPSKIKNRTAMKMKQIKASVRANYSTGKDKQVCPYKAYGIEILHLCCMPLVLRD